MGKRYINKAIGILALSSIVIVSGCSTSVQGNVSDDTPVSVEVSSVQKEVIGAGNVYTGIVTPSEEVRITPKVAGKVIDIPVKVGLKVKKGQVLLKIDDKDLQYAVDKANAAVSVAEANVESAVTSHESSMTQAKSGTVSSKSGMSSSKGSMIQSKSGIISAENAMSQASDSVTKAQSAVKQAENDVKDRKIEAKKELQNLNDAKKNLQRTEGLYDESLVSKKELEQAQTAVVNAQAAYDQGKVESNTLNEKLKTAKKALTTSKETYTNAKKTYTNAKNIYANASDAYANASDGYTNAKKQEEIAKSEAGIQASEQALKQAQVNAQIAQDQLDDATITSPIDGVVSEKKTEKGEMVSTQAPVLVLNNFDKVNILAYIPNDKINEVKIGNTVQVKIPSSNIITTGKVVTVSPLDESGKGHPVEIEVKNTKSQLKEGMIADIKVIPPKAKQGIVVPTNAIEYKGEKAFVYVAKGNQAERREVKLDKVDGSLLVVTDGLVDGDKIITSNLSLLSDKSKITYSQDESK